MMNIKTQSSVRSQGCGLWCYTLGRSQIQMYVVHTCTHSTQIINCLVLFFGFCFFSQQLYGFLHLAFLAQSHHTLTLTLTYRHFFFFPYILLKGNFSKGKPEFPSFISTPVNLCTCRPLTCWHPIHSKIHSVLNE